MYEDGGCGEHVGWDATELRAGHINKGAAQSYPPGPLSVVILTCRRLTRNNAASRTLCNMQRPDGPGLFGEEKLTVRSLQRVCNVQFLGFSAKNGG